MKLIKKREILSVKSTPVDPAQIPDPKTAAEFVKRGMAYYARHQYGQAEADLSKATSLDPRLVDAHYALGMVLKAGRSRDEAVRAFQKAISLIESGAVEAKTTSEMLRRLALGHVNQLLAGDWNLEKEIWHHV